jgi:hypothetical protein
VKIKGEPLGDALSSRTVEPIALLQQGFKSRTGIGRQASFFEISFEGLALAA